MNEIAVCMNAVAAMEDLCFMDQGAVLDQPPRAWSLPQYDLLLDTLTGQVRFAVWALQLTVAVSYQVGYWPIIGKIFLHDMPEGRVNFQYRVLTNSSTFTGNVGDLPLNSSGSGFPTTTTTLGVALTAGQLRVTPSYSGASMSAHDVFSRVLAVMVVGAETGPESPCNGIVGRAGGIAGIDITPERDEQGHSLLKYRQLIKAMRICLALDGRKEKVWRGRF